MGGAIGFLIGTGAGVGGLTLYAFWMLRFRAHFVPDAPEALESFGELALLVAVELLMVVGFLWPINGRRRRRWNRGK